MNIEEGWLYFWILLGLPIFLVMTGFCGSGG